MEKYRSQQRATLVSFLALALVSTYISFDLIGRPELGALARLEERLQGFDERLISLEKRLLEQASSNRDARGPENHFSFGPSLLTDGLHLRTRGLSERLDYVERKLSASVNWLPDPQLMTRTQYTCAKTSDWETNDDMRVCLDHIDRDWGGGRDGKPKRPCILYDLGIRTQPEFGIVAARDFGCKVRAFDPSPVSTKWWREGTDKKVKYLKGLGEEKYKFHDYGAGGTDGIIQLFEYNWGQVSIVKQEQDLTRKKKDGETLQRAFNLPVKTLYTMMKENGDTEIDILKVDIEGSEWSFFADIFDRLGCPPAEQVTLEYHHFSLDERYGSSPEINTFYKLMNDCGFKAFYTRDHWRNFATKDDTIHLEPKRYGFASFCRDCWKP